MARTQERLISAPGPADKDMKDFAATLQFNAEQLFEDAHVHSTRTTAPTAREGAVGDIVLVDDGVAGKIYVKFPRLGWGYFTATF